MFSEAHSQDEVVQLVSIGADPLSIKTEKGIITFSETDFIKEYESFKEEYSGQWDDATKKAYEKAIAYLKKQKDVVVADEDSSPEELQAFLQIAKNRVAALLLKAGKANVQLYSSVPGYMVPVTSIVVRMLEPQIIDGSTYTFIYNQEIFFTGNVTGEMVMMETK
jgi:hypothetical protein